MIRYIEFYDKNGNAFCGSDSIWLFDQRYSNKTAMRKTKEQAEKQAAAYNRDKKKYVKPKNCYGKIIQSDRINSNYQNVIVDTFMIFDNGILE